MTGLLREDERPRGIVYGIRTLHPDTLASIELGYLGKTWQRLRAREMQHRDEQPWEDVIVGSAYVISQGFSSDAELLEAERWAIRMLKPRYNVAENRANPDRISPEAAVVQRQSRDRARGVPLWLPPAAPVGERPQRQLTTYAEKKQNDRAAKPMTSGHQVVLANIAAGVCSPARIAAATGYSERQVYNILVELRGSFELIERVGHGAYTLTNTGQS